MPNVFETLAPRGPIKGADDLWDVFLSYRSVNRPWVLRLYDQLRHLGYEVFMDQFVLTTSGGLNAQLEQHLERSATAVLIWSSRSEESKWCEDEYNSLRTLEKSKPGFRYVVVRVDQVELPLMAQMKLWIDFSGQPDGPTGTGLLRLLNGLQGKPLSDEAVRVAAAYDEAFARALARLSAARKNGDPDTLLELARSDAPEWTTTATLPCKVAESLIALKRPADALPLLEAMITRFPRSVRPQQLKGLALARMGQWRAAQQVLGELHELGERDPETLGILARTWRDRFAESKDPLHLRKARNLYAEAFESTPSDYYTGINAASNSVLLGDLDAAEKLAAAVERLVGTQPRKGDYWGTATVAEVQLVRRRFEEAAALYAAAVEDDPEAKGSHESTLAQARRLMDKLAPSAEERAAVEAAFGSPPP
jgi:tetratricopeptide (TPR) repeat protein